MERVAFLIESTGERIACLLNPEALVVRRVAGVRPRRMAGSHLTGAGLTDDPLLYTGGGRTELDLELLFDVSLTDPTSPVEDVRDLTGPLWKLAENAQDGDGYGKPPLVRFVWGKSWNIPGVVSAISERLESFAATGSAQRSWLKLRLLRADEPAGKPAGDGPALPPPIPALAGDLAPAANVTMHQVLGTGGAADEPQGSESLYDVAFRYYGNPAMWRLIAAYNGIADPLRVPPGTVLRIPPEAGAAASA
jgi:Contractile injection system tube protein